MSRECNFNLELHPVYLKLLVWEYKESVRRKWRASSYEAAVSGVSAPWQTADRQVSKCLVNKVNTELCNISIFFSRVSGDQRVEGALIMVLNLPDGQDHDSK